LTLTGGSEFKKKNPKPYSEVPSKNNNRREPTMEVLQKIENRPNQQWYHQASREKERA
jgi:hypothetical protein